MSDNQITKLSTVFNGYVAPPLSFGSRPIAIMHNPSRDYAVAVRFTDDGIMDISDEDEARAEQYHQVPDHDCKLESDGYCPCEAF